MKIFFASVIKPHGIKGEVEIDYSDYDTLISGIKLYTEGEDVYTVESVKKKNSSLVLKFIEIDTLEHAEKMRKMRLYVYMEDLPKLGEDSFYIAELIGLSIKDKDGNMKGSIKDAYSTKAHTVIVAETKDSGVSVHIPFVKRYVGEINKDKKEAVVFDFESFLGN